MKTQTLQITVTVSEAENGTDCLDCPFLEICTQNTRNTKGIECDTFDLTSWIITKVKTAKK